MDNQEYAFWSAVAPYVVQGRRGCDMHDAVQLELVSKAARAAVKASLALVEGTSSRWGAPRRVASYGPTCELSECCEVFFNNYKDFATVRGGVPRTMWRSWAPARCGKRFYKPDQKDLRRYFGEPAVGFTKKLCKNPIPDLCPDANFIAVEMWTGNPKTSMQKEVHDDVSYSAGMLSYVVEHCPNLCSLFIDDYTQKYFFDNLESLPTKMPNLVSFTFTLVTELTDKRLTRIFELFPNAHELALKSCYNVTHEGLARLLRERRLTRLSALGTRESGARGYDGWGHGI